MRTFETGATRNDDTWKLDYESFLSPAVIKRYAQYLNKHRALEDGTLRAGDNWQQGIGKDVYMKSMFRHFMDVWSQHRDLPGDDELQESLCAVIFNASGYLFELLREERDGSNDRS
jgi:hypothetical protein